MASSTSITMEADQYLTGMQVKFQSAKRDWENFADQIMEKSKEILLSGLEPEISGGYTGNGYHYNANIDLDKNRPALKQYLSTVKDQLHGKGERFEAAIADFDRKLEYFRANGLEEERIAKLVRHFAQWVDYAAVLTFRYEEIKYEIRLPDATLARKQHWQSCVAAPDSKVPGKQKLDAPSGAARKEETASDPVQELREKRQAETGRIQETLKSEYEAEFAALKAQYDADLKEINDKKSQTGKELSEKKAYLETLGFFQFGEKKTTRNAIIALEQTKVQLQRDVEALKDNFDLQKNGLKTSIESSWDRQRKQIRKKFPTPRNIGLLDIVLLEMDPGSKYTIQEITEFPGIPVEATPRVMNDRVVSPLVAQGKLRRVYENGRTYFKLP